MSSVRTRIHGQQRGPTSTCSPSPRWLLQFSDLRQHGYVLPISNTPGALPLLPITSPLSVDTDSGHSFVCKFEGRRYGLLEFRSHGGHQPLYPQYTISADDTDRDEGGPHLYWGTVSPDELCPGLGVNTVSISKVCILPNEYEAAFASLVINAVVAPLLCAATQSSWKYCQSEQPCIVGDINGESSSSPLCTLRPCSCHHPALSFSANDLRDHYTVAEAYGSATYLQVSSRPAALLRLH
jgi:hypothetical protein